MNPTATQPTDYIPGPEFPKHCIKCGHTLWRPIDQAAVQTARIHHANGREKIACYECGLPYKRTHQTATEIPRPQTTEEIPRPSSGGMISDYLAHLADLYRPCTATEDPRQPGTPDTGVRQPVTMAELQVHLKHFQLERREQRKHMLLKLALKWIRRIEDRADDLPKSFTDNGDVKLLRKEIERVLES